MNGRQAVSYMGASILLSEKPSPSCRFASCHLPRKGEVLREAPPFGGAGTASAVTERVLVFTHTHFILYENA